jgi:hypothetical protein
MNFSFPQQTGKRSLTSRSLVAALVLGCSLDAVTQSVAQVTPPPTPDKITPPAGGSCAAGRFAPFAPGRSQVVKAIQTKLQNAGDQESLC